MNKAPQPSAAPEPPAAIRVPQPNDPDMLEARKRKMLESFGSRKGRESTNLAPGGAGDYSRTTLG